MAPTDIDPIFEQFLATSWRHPPSDQLLPSPSPSPDLPSTPPPLPSAPPPSPTYSSAFEEIAKLRSSATSRWASEVQEETFVYTPNEVEELVEPIKEDINTIAAPSPDRSTSSSRWATEVPSAPVPQTTNFSIKGLAARKAASSRTFSEDNNTETDWGDTSSELSLRTDDGDDRAITNDSSSVSLKGSRGCQTHRFRRPTSDASTLKPRKAQSKAQSSFTVDTRLSQAQSCYSSVRSLSSSI